jgi:putative zinc finger/helix-turn-helix YgiT family protein
MKCHECRGTEIEVRHENHRYDESGLPNVVLLDVEVRHCSKCGTDELVIPRMAGLHRSIALALIGKTDRLTPAEIKFLRKSLGWSQTDFAKSLHVADETANRWEAGKRPMEDGYELALRLAVAQGQQIEDYDVSRLADIGVGEQRATRLSMKVGDAGWRVQDAA